jgi:hypothetical protein
LYAVVANRKEDKEKKENKGRIRVRLSMKKERRQVSI